MTPAERIKSLFRFVQVSGLSFVVNIGLTVFLHEVCLLAEEIAYAVALVVVFLMNFFLLRHYIYEGAQGPLVQQFAAFGVSSLGFRAGEYVMFLALHSGVGLDYRAVVIGISLVSSCAKFLFYGFVFRKPEDAPVNN